MKTKSTDDYSTLGRVRATLQNPALLALIGTLIVGATLRLWGIDSLFNAVHDYDPGVHALAARFIAEGYLPYRDFAQVHPPLYDFVLAAVFKVFGYEFLYGRYLSVCLSLVSLVLVYFLGRRVYSHRVGVVAALLFAVEPMMVYFGRRCVQEALGLLLVLIGATLAVRSSSSAAADYSSGAGWFLGWQFRPNMSLSGYRGHGVRHPVACAASRHVEIHSQAGLPTLLGAVRFPFGCRLRRAVFASLYGVDTGGTALRGSLAADHGDLAVSLLVFGVPLLLLWHSWIRGLHVGAWFRSLWAEVIGQRLWLLVVGGLVGFLTVTGYFWITMPGAYLEQTVFWQMGRATTEVPSLVGMARIAFLSSAFFRMSLLSIVAMVPLALVLLNRRPFTRGDCFLVIVIIVTIVLSRRSISFLDTTRRRWCLVWWRSRACRSVRQA